MNNKNQSKKLESQTKDQSVKTTVDEKTSAKPKDLKKRLIISASIFVIGLVLLIVGYFWYSQRFANLIYPNVKIGQIDVGGKTQEEAKSTIIQQSKNNLWAGHFKDSQKIYDIKGSDIDLNYDFNKTVEEVYKIGRTGNFFADTKTRLVLLFTQKNIKAIYHIDNDKLTANLSNIYKEVESPVTNAHFNFIDGKVDIISEQSGTSIDKIKLVNQINDSLGNIETNLTTSLAIVQINPKITTAELTSVKPKVDAAVAEIIVLKSEIKNIDISKENIFSYIDIVAKPNDTKKSLSFFGAAHAKEIGYEVEADINIGKIRQFLESIRSDVNKDTKNAKLTFKDGKAEIFQSPEKGYKLDEEETAKKIATLLFSRMGVKGTSTDKMISDSKELEMALTVTEPDVSDTNIDKLGIKELVGTGTTSFYGSPNNRVFNITHGAKQFDGLLIKPGDTLSAIGIIGDPSAETGYLPELVIKGSTTIPEYGGGLCQVSTTMFRAALNAGFEIVERSNHAYRVSYYEPPVGMDATIYYPKPDFIFRNNTKNYVLVQSIVDGYTITFNFYGTKDDRQVEISDPVILDTIPAPADKYVESSTLASGEIKKKESSHPGAHASFHYKVTIDGKVAIDQDFLSYYTPWQALYYYGPGTTGIPGVADPAPSNPDPAPAPAPEPAPTTSAPTPSPSPSPSST